MKELERRVAAIEMAFYEVGAWLEPQASEDAQRSIIAGLDHCCAEERAVRLGALQLIEDARKRFTPPSSGLALKKDLA